MTYRLKHHLKLIKATMPLWSLLLLCQIPEILVTLVQKQIEKDQTDPHFFLFFLIYPVFCIFSALSSALTYLVIEKSSKPRYLREVLSALLSKLLLLSGAASLLGIVFLVATLAFVIPGVLVMAFYLFVPFLILQPPKGSFWSYFSESKQLFRKNKTICLFTSSAMVVLSILSFLGFLEAPLILEIGISLLLSLVLNVWISTVFIEVSRT